MLSAEETWAFSVLASAFADGTLWRLDTTLTVPFIPEWMLQ